MNKKATNSADKEIGARIRQVRTQLGWSQEKLAESLGLTFQQIQKYEKGINRLSASRLLTVAGILGVPVSFFFNGLAGQEALTGRASEIQTFLGLKDAIELAQAFVKIENPALRRALVDMAQAVANS